MPVPAPTRWRRLSTWPVSYLGGEGAREAWAVWDRVRQGALDTQPPDVRKTL